MLKIVLFSTLMTTQGPHISRVHHFFRCKTFFGVWDSFWFNSYKNPGPQPKQIIEITLMYTYETCFVLASPFSGPHHRISNSHFIFMSLTMKKFMIGNGDSVTGILRCVDRVGLLSFALHHNLNKLWRIFITGDLKMHFC